MNYFFRRSVHVVLALPLLLIGSQCLAVQITNVSHEPAMFDPQKSETMLLRFRNSDQAQVTVKMFDGRDLLIRTLVDNKSYPAGEHEIN